MACVQVSVVSVCGRGGKSLEKNPKTMKHHPPLYLVPKSMYVENKLLIFITGFRKLCETQHSLVTS